METLPTPYDITDIPRFAFEPSSTTWIAMLSGCILLVLLALAVRWMRSRRLSPERAATLLRSRLLTLRAEVHSSNRKLVSEELSLLLRRFLAVQFGANIPALSRSELESWCAKDLDAPGLKKPWTILFRATVTLEDYKYSPEPASTETLADIMQTTLNAIDDIMAMK